MDGWVTLGTKLDTKQLDKDLKESERKLKSYEREAEKLTTTKAKIEIDNKEARNKFALLTTELKNAKKELKTLQLTGGTGNSIMEANKNVISLTKQVEQAKNEWSKQLVAVNQVNKKIKENATNQALVRQEIAKTTRNLEGTNGLKEMGNDLDKMDKKTSSLIKKVAKWGLAIFGIRSAYMLVRQAMSTLSQYDEKLASNIEYIRYALAMSLKPIIEWIVNEVYKILTYINYIANAWFGVDLFKNASIDNFNKGLDKANKKSKELKKTLMSFDEANILQKTSDSSGGGSVSPSFDLSKPSQIDIPDWVKWIADNKDLIIELAGIVGIAFGTAKTLELLGNISKIMGVAGGIGKIGGTGLAGLMTSLASIVAIAGGIAIIGYVVASTWADLNKLSNEIDEITQKQQKLNQEKTKEIKPSAKVTELTMKTKANIQGGRDLLKLSNNYFMIITGNAEKYETASRKVAENTSVTLSKAKELWNYENRTREEKEEILRTLREQYSFNNLIIGQLSQQGKKTDDLKMMNQDLENQIKSYTKQLTRADDIWWTIDGDVKQTISDVSKLNKERIDDKSFKVNMTGNAIKDFEQLTLNMVKTKLLSNSLVNMIPNAKGLINKFLTIGNLPQLLKLANQYGIKFATGGIVNMPNRGVPIGGNVIAGESGREGVIPLTDPTAMSALGQEIGKWVNIGIENNMVVDGRILATATNDRINKESFLMNR